MPARSTMRSWPSRAVWKKPSGGRYIYKLGSGQHLFDTYVPLLSFSISRETVTTRYVGLEVPPDDTGDMRLKQPNVVAVLTYASEDRLIREALVTCDDPKQAQLLRSYADTTRAVS